MEPTINTDFHEITIFVRVSFVTDCGLLCRMKINSTATTVRYYMLLSQMLTDCECVRVGVGGE